MRRARWQLLSLASLTLAACDGREMPVFELPAHVAGAGTSAGTSSGNSGASGTNTSGSAGADTTTSGSSSGGTGAVRAAAGMLNDMTAAIRRLRIE